MSRDAAAPPVTVVGGTYREQCAEPLSDALYGSGVRAAGILTSLGHRVEFYTCVDRASRREAESVLSCLRIDAAMIADRPQPLSFRYVTPVSPATWTSSPISTSVEIAADVVLAFGMIDMGWSVTGERVVVDPQHGDLESMMNSTKATSLAVVLNANEAERQTGLGPREAGHHLRSRGVEVVVIKRGALGGLVFSDAGVEAYGAIPTNCVRPIGSGDAFTAGFTHAWTLDPSAPVDAARFGAQVAAAHSLIGIPQVSHELLATLPEPLPAIGETPRVYVAAQFFTLSESLLLEVIRSGLCDSGIAVFSPFHDIGLGGDEVALADLDGLQACHAVLALLDGADPGTVFEVGWATKASVPIVGFSGQPSAHEWTMLRGTGSMVTDDLPTAVYQAGWAAIREVCRREHS